jgi:predicted O-methyltransferase YrrM
VAASPAEGQALRRWVVSERATRTIEVGLGYGISTLFICDGLLEVADPAAHHIAIDPYQSDAVR